jgi:DNA-binding response OmpR family regulator
MNRKILIIEDEPWLAEGYAVVLRGAGFKCQHVRTAHDAIDAIDDFGPHLLLLDMFLPHVNGLQLLHELKSYPDLMKVPIILCSAVDLRFNKKELEQYGVREFIKKSQMTPHRLVGSVKDAFHHEEL